MMVGTDSQRISVIIPVFNDEPGVRACLEALGTQTWQAEKFEVVVVDNALNPTLCLSRDYPFAVRVERCDKPGSYAARNKGASVATGDVLAFTDADCVPDEDWLANGVAALRQGGGKVVVGGEVSMTKPQRRTGAGLYQYATGFGQRENIDVRGFAATANFLCTAEQFQAVGAFDERLLSGGDLEWAWRAGQSGMTVTYAADVVVYTSPRESLRAAIRQARRVAAGRYHLRREGLDRVGPEGLRPHRGSFESVAWILQGTEFTFRERAGILAAAIILKATSTVENWRLRWGLRPERR